MKKLLFYAPFLAVLGLLLSAPARAAAPLILPRTEGGFIEIHSGMTAETREGLLSLLGAASSTPVTSSASGSAVAAATSTSVVGADQPLTFSLKAAIIRGRDFLNARLAAEDAKLKRPKTVPSQNIWVDVTLAVWNSTTDEIKLVEVKKNGAKIRAASADEAPQVSVRYSNGVNSQFTLADAATQYVVAVKYPVFTEKRISRRKKVYAIHDVVYTPYSDQLQTPEIVDWGKASFDAAIAGVYAELRAKDIRSRAFPDRRLADVIDPDLVKSIVLIEHLGPQRLLGDDPLSAAESVYVVLALNQDAAYDYSRSTAGAEGLVQFIPSTYKLMTKRKDLGLIANFDAGMADHANAIKAEAAYLDSELAALPFSVRDLYAVDPARVDEYLAASYNGGSARVSKAIQTWGDAWSADRSDEIAQLTARRKQLSRDVKTLTRKVKKETDAKARKKLKNDLYLAQKGLNAAAAQATLLSKTSLRVETVDYVKKLRVVQGLIKPPPPVTLASAS